MTAPANPNNLRVRVIGCSGTYSSTDSACSSYLVQTDSTSVLLDAGPGSSIELQQHIELADIDAVVLSHEHPDHWTEMPSLYHAYRYGIDKPGLAVYGTIGTKAALDAVVPEATELTFDWTTIDASATFTIGDMSFTFSETDHPVETLAIRVESGGTAIGYSADTGPDWSPELFADSIDLMIYETTLPNDLEDADIPHVSGRQAGVRATAAGVRKLILTHVPPGHNAQDRAASLAETFDGPAEIAEPGRSYIP